MSSLPKVLKLVVYNWEYCTGKNIMRIAIKILEVELFDVSFNKTPSNFRLGSDCVFVSVIDYECRYSCDVYNFSCEGYALIGSCP